MLRQSSLRWSIPLTVVVLLVPGCSDSADEAASTTMAPTTTETTTESTAPATTAPTTTTTSATTTTASTTTLATVTPLEDPRILENGDFEAGDLTGWMTEEIRDGEWLVYDNGQEQPDPRYAVPEHEGVTEAGMDFDLPDPPQGRYAAVTDTQVAGAGVRFLYRDIDVTEPYTLIATVFYQNTWSTIRDPGHFTLTDEKQTQWYQNQQYRVEIIDPAAPVDTVEPDDIWGTVYKTEPGDPAYLEPIRVSFDLSPWQDATVRLRPTSVSHVYGPMRAGVDDVDVRLSS